MYGKVWVENLELYNHEANIIFGTEILRFTENLWYSQCHKSKINKLESLWIMWQILHLGSNGTGQHTYEKLQQAKFPKFQNYYTGIVKYDGRKI